MAEEVKILLVDDEPDFTHPTASWLTSEGYYVMVAPDGLTALRLIKDNTPDIVFLDLRMPVMDGLEVLKRIREFNKDLPVVLVTAYVDDPQVRQISTFGISGVFYKGDDYIELLSLIKTCVKKTSLGS